MDGHTEIPDSWIKRLKQNIANDRSAPKKWCDIKSVGLEGVALFFLSAYAGGPAADLTEMHKRTKEADRRFKAAIRAERIVRTGTPKRCRPDTDRRRAIEAHKAAIRALWPIPIDGVSTVADEMELVAKQTGKQLKSAVVRWALVKAGGKRSPLGPKYSLMLLQAYADKYGVKLGVKTLATLANCADPKRALDPRDLRRYLQKYRPIFANTLGKLGSLELEATLKIRKNF